MCVCVCVCVCCECVHACAGPYARGVQGDSVKPPFLETGHHINCGERQHWSRKIKNTKLLWSPSRRLKMVFKNFSPTHQAVSGLLHSTCVLLLVVYPHGCNSPSKIPTSMSAVDSCIAVESLYCGHFSPLYFGCNMEVAVLYRSVYCYVETQQCGLYR